jgi:NAD(P)H-nitrite reductase large subunit
MGVTKGDIIKAVNEQGLKTVAEIGNTIEAGTVCEGCVLQIEAVIKEVL